MDEALDSLPPRCVDETSGTTDVDRFEGLPSAGNTDTGREMNDRVDIAKGGVEGVTISTVVGGPISVGDVATDLGHTGEL
jgi:hypothetical protein